MLPDLSSVDVATSNQDNRKKMYNSLVSRTEIMEVLYGGINAREDEYRN